MYQVIPYSAWSTDRMIAHLQELADLTPVGEGIWLPVDCWYAAVFFLDLEEEIDFFVFDGRNFYNGGPSESSK